MFVGLPVEFVCVCETASVDSVCVCVLGVGASVCEGDRE